MTMHANSLLAYEEERPRLSARAELVFANVKQHGPGTDREIMARMGFTDLNQVRPRITELVKSGLLVEVAQRVCDVTGKRVRVVGVPPVKVGQ
jgi:hypothetical protein